MDSYYSNALPFHPNLPTALLQLSSQLPLKTAPPSSDTISRETVHQRDYLPSLNFDSHAWWSRATIIPLLNY